MTPLRGYLTLGAVFATQFLSLAVHHPQRPPLWIGVVMYGVAFVGYHFAFGAGRFKP